MADPEGYMSTTRVMVLKLLQEAKPCTVVEIGAHVGQDTGELWLCAGAEKSRYLALEPDPRNADEFRKAHGSKQLRFIEAAISDRSGLAVYSGSYPYTGSGSLKKPVEHLSTFPEVSFSSEFRTTVVTITLDEIVEKFGLTKIDLIWADVQGSEDLLISGGQKALSMTRWLHTEFYDSEVYEGQLGKEEIQKRLPGEWKLVETWQNDALFENLSLKS
jgi:FkbM family methyltransferase